MSPSRLVPALLTLFSLIFLAPSSMAQLPQGGDTTSPPTPGAGHDYLCGPAETVKPANGEMNQRYEVDFPPRSPACGSAQWLTHR